MNELVLKIKRLLPRSLAISLPRKIKVIFVSPNESEELNLKYRKINKPTNVLSFKYDLNYGEILLCPEVIKREAKKLENSYKYQMTWMILHGMMHLGGMHHEKSEALAKKAERLENKILKKVLKL